MKRSLGKLVSDYVIRNGKNARAQLCIDSNLSISLIDKVKGGYLPGGEAAYRLAITLGCTESEAAKIAEHCEHAREKLLKAV